MSVFRVHKTQDYTTMSNLHFREKNMSLKAKGLLSLMLSLPDDWDYSISGLCSICTEKENAIKSTLNELKQFGYLIVNKIMPNNSKSGRIEYVYNIFEFPQDIEKQDIEKQVVENQGVENQSVENPLQLNTNILNTKELNTNKQKESKTAQQKSSFDFLIDEYCDKNNQENVKSLLKDWLKVRKAKRAPMTDKAIQLNLEKLNECANESKLSVDKYLEEVIRRGWQAFYPIIQYGQTKKKSKVYNYDASIDEIFGIKDDNDE